VSREFICWQRSSKIIAKMCLLQKQVAAEDGQ
jgi:hypothetical protein